jgi:prepilin-type N-terminal cleavage/methylation domain-containing protein
MRRLSTKLCDRQRGFSILEMMLATILLLVGLVAVAQLVPASILLNYRNRTDSSALVYAQRELDQFLGQPLTVTSFTDADGNVCSLGNPAAPNTVLPDSTAAIFYNGQTVINFNDAPQPGYNFLFPNPATANPTDVIYDVRWAVIVTGSGGTASSKRFIVGVRQAGGSGYFQPITLDTMVEK